MMETVFRVAEVRELRPTAVTLRGYLIRLECGHFYKQVPHMMPPSIGTEKRCWRCADEARKLAEYPRGQAAYEERAAEELRDDGALEGRFLR